VRPEELRAIRRAFPIPVSASEDPRMTAAKLGFVIDGEAYASDWE